MQVIISSKNNEKTFFDKEIINIGSKPDCDFVINSIPGNDLILTLQCDKRSNKCVLLNNFMNRNILFKGQPVGQKLEIEKLCKLVIANSDDFISIKISDQQHTPQTTSTTHVQSPETNAIEQQKTNIESKRVGIIKQVGFAINDIKNRISLNYKGSLFVHIALFFSALVTAFGVSNYMTGLQIDETQNFIHLPMNIKILLMFTVIIYGLALTLKQGVFLFFQNKIKSTTSTVVARNFMISSSMIFFIGIYIINLLYYSSINPIFAVLVSLFFVGLTVVLSIACGYFKNAGHSMSYELDKYEYREDFELVMNEYRAWIEKYINNFGKTKIANIKEKLFNLQLKSVGETILGILTAPFLAYGVSNTLATCFPEAAGWLRISGLRISPIFLVLSTFLIVFAFFAFVNAFLSIRKTQGANVIKQDGFTDYLTHGTEIFGIQGIRKLESDKIRSLVIGCSIILIEFTMNTSYFFGEIGGDLQGIMLSVIAALVPTALLIAETYMLSQTKFDIYACEGLLSKLDKD